MLKVKMICANCRGYNVVHDAWAEWDTKAQEWVLSQIFDDEHCNDCEGETNIIEERL